MPCGDAGIITVDKQSRMKSNVKTKQNKTEERVSIEEPRCSFSVENAPQPSQWDQFKERQREHESTASNCVKEHTSFNLVWKGNKQDK